MSQVNTWGISKWVYRFGRKRTSMDKKRLLERVRDIFNGHSYKVNGYISVRHKMDLRYDSLSYKKYQCGRIELEIQSVGTKSWYKEARSTFRLTPGAGCGESRTSGFELESHL